MFLQNILSALRGPDNGHDNFKWLTTARIRAITCSTYAGNINFGPLNIQEMQLRDKLLYDDGQAPAHFSRHYDDACWAIRVIFGYDLREEQKLSAETWQALLTALRK
jgi:hypothetical protein